MSEHTEQCVVFYWAKLSERKYPELWLLNSSLNGVKLNMGVAVKAKRSGMKKGYPDISLPVAKNGFHGLFIELKVGKNTTTPAQKEWIKRLTEQGYFCEVCFGAKNAIEVIKNYLQGKNDRSN